MTRFLPLTLLALMGMLRPAGGQLDELAALKASRERVDRVSQSLQQIRSRFMARRDSLSSRIDSLRSRAPGIPDLRRLQLESRQLLHRLNNVEVRLDSAAAEMEALDEKLRAAYDWEISQLIRLLEDGGWDAGLYRQLEVFQEERRVLGYSIGQGHYRLDDAHELALADGDGPEEIRQKLELAQYMAVRARKDWHRLSHRLDSIERELLLLQQFGPGEAALVSRAGAGSQRQQVGDIPPGEAVAPPPAEAPLLLESQRLKARQQELREVLAFLQGRISAFNARMDQILNGAE